MTIALTIFFSVLFIVSAYYVGNRTVDSFYEDITVQIMGTVLGCLIICLIIGLLIGIGFGFYYLVSLGLNGA